MQDSGKQAGDSVFVHGGTVPGNPGIPAYVLKLCDPSPIPVVIAVPHAGRAYPRALLDRMRHPDFAAPRLEDRYVDLLAEAVALETGAALLVAHAPRAMLDLNRSCDDVDWEMLGGVPADASTLPGTFSRRARSGLGLVPRRLPGLGELWKRRLDHAELQDRIGAIHQPYHSALASALELIRDRWGAALLIDLHSMPPLAARSAGEAAPEFVIGDRFGSSCDGGIIGSAFAVLAQSARRASHNRPYAGGYVLERHAKRHEGVHCFQLEIDRTCYLDQRQFELGVGFDATVSLLIGLVRRLAVDVAELGRTADRGRWRAAAE
ncbi:MAG: N-formylglutamate amidohydrolase [Novosphingobium sp. 32-60-15]|uniref:N-formylglutamate amidohydrolase n=1 Tax=unclassified Novosphingobium TaxID=2644732 RepID=UPI000BCF58AF|nr:MULTISPECIES: N-formylglutamate amidohydrolase [unclassified Novosphingobium]OYX61400.1 MAG: N-formylglutamate amidohydrolase [Novosphingobium sp. 32-60-15]